MVPGEIGHLLEYRGVTGTPRGVSGPYWALVEKRRGSPTWAARPSPPWSELDKEGGGAVGERNNFKKNPTHTQDHGDA